MSTNESVTASPSALAGLSVATLNSYLGELTRLAKDGGAVADQLASEAALMKLLSDSGLGAPTAMAAAQRRAALSKALGLIFAPTQGNSLRGVLPGQFAALVGLYGGASNLLASAPELVSASDPLLLTDAVFAGLVALELNRVVKVVGPRLYVSLSEAQVRALSSDQLSAISAGADAAKSAGAQASAWLPAAFLNKLNSVGVAKLLWNGLLEWVLADDTVRPGLAAATLGRVPAVTWSLLSDAAVQRLSTEQFQGLAASVINAASDGKPSLWQRMTAAQQTLYSFGKLSLTEQPAAWLALNGAQRLQILRDSHLAPRIPATVLAVLTPDEAAQLSAQDWARLSDGAVQGLSSAALAALSRDTLTTLAGAAQTFLLQRLTMPQQLACTIPLNLPDAPALNRYAAALLEMAQTGSLQSSASLPQEPAFIWLKAYGAVADLSTLNSPQRRDWLSKVLDQLFNPANANHLSDLTAAQFTALTGPYGGAAALLSAVPSLLQEAQALRLNSAVFSTLPAGALNGLAKLVGPSLYLGLSEAELRALNTDQLMAISAGADAARVAGKAAAQFLPAAFLNKLNATAVSRILWSHLLEWVLQDDGVRTGLSKTTVGSVPVMTWSLLSDGALQRLSSEQLNGVSAGVANASSNGKPTLLQRLSPAQRTLYTVGKLSAAAQPGGFAALSPADRLVVLQDDFTVTLLGGATLATFSAVEWGAVSDAALQGMTSTQLGTIPFTVAQNRTDSTARSLLQRMTPAQQDIYGFGQLSAADQTTKFADRSTAQKLLLVHDAYIGPRLSGATLARLSALEWAQVSDAAIQRMPSGQFLGIPAGVASASTSAGSRSVLQRMTSSQQTLYSFYKASATEQLSRFTGMIVEHRRLLLEDAYVGPRLSAATVRLVSVAEWAAVSDASIRRLTPMQLDAITADTLAGVDATGYSSVTAAQEAGRRSVLARLSGDQVAIVTVLQASAQQQPADLLALSPAQRLALLGDAYIGPKLFASSWAVVTPSEWAQLSDAAVQRLQPAQLAKLTLATLTALSEGNRAPLLQRLSFAQLAGIDWSAALPTAQTLNDYVAELARVATAGGAVSTLMLAQPAFVRLWVEAGVAKPGELDATQRRAWLGQALGLLFDAAHGPHGPHSATALSAASLQGLLDAYDTSAAALFAAVPNLLKGAEPLTLLSPTYTGLPEAYRKSLLVDLGAALLQPLSKAQVQALTSTTIAEIAAAADSARSLGRTSATVLPASFINLLTSQQFLSLFPSAGGRAGEPVRLEWILMDPANGPLVDGTWLALWGENYWRKASPGLVQRLTTRQLAAFSESTVFTLAPGGDRSLWTKLLDSQAKRFKETKLSLEQLNDLFANPTHDKSGMMRDEYIAERLSAPALALATAENWAQVPNGVLSGYRIEQLVDIPKAVAQAAPDASLGSLLQRLAPATQTLYGYAQSRGQEQATAFTGYAPTLRQAILSNELLAGRLSRQSLAALSAKDWDQISDAALRGLSAEQLSGITPATASSLGSRLSVNQWVDYNFLQCSEAQQSSYFAGLPAAQRQRLVQDAYMASRLNAASIAQLSASDWASVSDAAIHALRTAQLLLIDLENVFATQGSATVPALQQRLTDAQMVGFGLGRLSAEEQNELFPQLSTEQQLLALQDEWTGPRIQPAYLTSVTVAQWAQVTKDAIQRLGHDQVDAIDVSTAKAMLDLSHPSVLQRMTEVQREQYLDASTAPGTPSSSPRPPRDIGDAKTPPPTGYDINALVLNKLALTSDGALRSLDTTDPYLSQFLQFAQAQTLDGGQTWSYYLNRSTVKAVLRDLFSAGAVPRYPVNALSGASWEALFAFFDSTSSTNGVAYLVASLGSIFPFQFYKDISAEVYGQLRPLRREQLIEKLGSHLADFNFRTPDNTTVHPLAISLAAYFDAHYSKFIEWGPGIFQRSPQLIESFPSPLRTAAYQNAEMVAAIPTDYFSTWTADAWSRHPNAQDIVIRLQAAQVAALPESTLEVSLNVDGRGVKLVELIHASALNYQTLPASDDLNQTLGQIFPNVFGNTRELQAANPYLWQFRAWADIHSSPFSTVYTVSLKLINQVLNNLFSHGRHAVTELTATTLENLFRVYENGASAPGAGNLLATTGLLNADNIGTVSSQVFADLGPARCLELARYFGSDIKNIDFAAHKGADQHPMLLAFMQRLQSYGAQEALVLDLLRPVIEHQPSIISYLQWLGDHTASGLNYFRLAMRDPRIVAAMQPTYIASLNANNWRVDLDARQTIPLLTAEQVAALDESTLALHVMTPQGEQKFIDLLPWQYMASVNIEQRWMRTLVGLSGLTITAPRPDAPQSLATSVNASAFVTQMAQHAHGAFIDDFISRWLAADAGFAQQYLMQFQNLATEVVSPIDFGATVTKYKINTEFIANAIKYAFASSNGLLKSISADAFASLVNYFEGAKLTALSGMAVLSEQTNCFKPDLLDGVPSGIFASLTPSQRMDAVAVLGEKISALSFSGSASDPLFLAALEYVKAHPERRTDILSASLLNKMTDLSDIARAGYSDIFVNLLSDPSLVPMLAPALVKRISVADWAQLSDLTISSLTPAQITAIPASILQSAKVTLLSEPDAKIPLGIALNVYQQPYVAPMYWFDGSASEFNSRSVSEQSKILEQWRSHLSADQVQLLSNLSVHAYLANPDRGSAAWLLGKLNHSQIYALSAEEVWDLGPEETVALFSASNGKEDFHDISAIVSGLSASQFAAILRAQGELGHVLTLNFPIASQYFYNFPSLETGYDFDTITDEVLINLPRMEGVGIFGMKPMLLSSFEAPANQLYLSFADVDSDNQNQWLPNYTAQEFVAIREKIVNASLDNMAFHDEYFILELGKKTYAPICLIGTSAYTARVRPQEYWNAISEDSIRSMLPLQIVELLKQKPDFVLPKGLFTDEFVGMASMEELEYIIQASASQIFPETTGVQAPLTDSSPRPIGSRQATDATAVGNFSLNNSTVWLLPKLALALTDIAKHRNTTTSAGYEIAVTDFVLPPGQEGSVRTKQIYALYGRLSLLERMAGLGKTSDSRSLLLQPRSLRPALAGYFDRVTTRLAGDPELNAAELAAVRLLNQPEMHEQVNQYLDLASNIRSQNFLTYEDRLSLQNDVGKLFRAAYSVPSIYQAITEFRVAAMADSGNLALQHTLAGVNVLVSALQGPFHLLADVLDEMSKPAALGFLDAVKVRYGSAIAEILSVLKFQGNTNLGQYYYFGETNDVKAKFVALYGAIAKEIPKVMPAHAEVVEFLRERAPLIDTSFLAGATEAQNGVSLNSRIVLGGSIPFFSMQSMLKNGIWVAADIGSIIRWGVGIKNAHSSMAEKTAAGQEISWHDYASLTVAYLEGPAYLAFLLGDGSDYIFSEVSEGNIPASVPMGARPIALSPLIRKQLFAFKLGFGILQSLSICQGIFDGAKRATKVGADGYDYGAMVAHLLLPSVNIGINNALARRAAANPTSLSGFALFTVNLILPTAGSTTALIDVYQADAEARRLGMNVYADVIIRPKFLQRWLNLIPITAGVYSFFGVELSDQITAALSANNYEKMWRVLTEIYRSPLYSPSTEQGKAFIALVESLASIAADMLKAGSSIFPAGRHTYRVTVLDARFEDTEKINAKMGTVNELDWGYHALVGYATSYSAQNGSWPTIPEYGYGAVSTYDLSTSVKWGDTAPKYSLELNSKAIPASSGTIHEALVLTSSLSAEERSRGLSVQLQLVPYQTDEMDIYLRSPDYKITAGNGLLIALLDQDSFLAPDGGVIAPSIEGLGTTLENRVNISFVGKNDVNLDSSNIRHAMLNFGKIDHATVAGNGTDISYIAMETQLQLNSTGGGVSASIDVKRNNNLTFANGGNNLFAQFDGAEGVGVTIASAGVGFDVLHLRENTSKLSSRVENGQTTITVVDKSKPNAQFPKLNVSGFESILYPDSGAELAVSGGSRRRSTELVEGAGTDVGDTVHLLGLGRNYISAVDANALKVQSGGGTDTISVLNSNLLYSSGIAMPITNIVAGGSSNVFVEMAAGFSTIDTRGIAYSQEYGGVLSADFGTGKQTLFLGDAPSVITFIREASSGDVVVKDFVYRGEESKVLIDFNTSFSKTYFGFTDSGFSIIAQASGAAASDNADGSSTIRKLTYDWKMSAGAEAAVASIRGIEAQDKVATEFDFAQFDNVIVKFDSPDGQSEWGFSIGALLKAWDFAQQAAVSSHTWTSGLAIEATNPVFWSVATNGGGGLQVAAGGG